MRVPGGGASCLGVGRLGSGALPSPTARPLGGLPVPTTHWLWVRGGAGVGTRHQPHGARSCELALRAVGAARGRPGGVPPAWVWGVRGRALSQPRLPALWAGCRGPLPTGCGCGGLRAWGPVTNPAARALACYGGGMRAPGGVASCLGVGRPGSGALPTPTARPLGGLPGPTTHWMWVRGGAGMGTRHQPNSARSCELALHTFGGHEGARGGRLLPGCGASGFGRSPTPDHPSFRACGRGPLPTGRGCGVRAWVPGCPWHLVPCRGSSCVVRASRVRGTRWPLWLGTCPRAVVVAGGVPLWRASWPRIGAPLLVRSGRSPCSGRLSPRRGAFPHLLTTT